MVVVVNDTSVLIDLIDMNLLRVYVDLGWELRTTDLILDELSDDAEYHQVEALVLNGHLIVESLDIQTMSVVAVMSIDNSGLSIEDCSVWHTAKSRDAILMTADQSLRKKAMTDGVEVHGSLYIVDKMLDDGAISAEEAIDALNELKAANERAPSKEIDQLIQRYLNQEE